MFLTPADIIEEIVDELASGELADRLDSVAIDRLAPGSLLLDYGDAGRFQLDVVQIQD